VNHTPGRLTILNAPLKTIIGWAYSVQASQVLGPASLDGEYYDIIGTAASHATEGQLRVMLQRLLLDRFKLSLQRKMKVELAYVLITGKGQSTLHISTEASEGTIDASGAGLTNLKRATVEQFAQLLSRPLKSPVVDMTRLKGLYDFKLDILPYIEIGDDGAIDDSKLDIPEILSQAVQDQLGLKLQLRKIPITVLMVDRVEKPSEN
jgi:uncharacterized protein (TIGR03435 family)